MSKLIIVLNKEMNRVLMDHFADVVGEDRYRFITADTDVEPDPLNHDTECELRHLTGILPTDIDLEYIGADYFEATWRGGSIEYYIMGGRLKGELNIIEGDSDLEWVDFTTPEGRDIILNAGDFGVYYSYLQRALYVLSGKADEDNKELIELANQHIKEVNEMLKAQKPVDMIGLEELL